MDGPYVAGSQFSNWDLNVARTQCHSWDLNVGVFNVGDRKVVAPHLRVTPKPLSKKLFSLIFYMSLSCAWSKKYFFDNFECFSWFTTLPMYLQAWVRQSKYTTNTISLIFKAVSYLVNWTRNIFSHGLISWLSLGVCWMSDIYVRDRVVLGVLDPLVSLHAIVTEIFFAFVANLLSDVLLIAALEKRISIF